MNWDFVDQLIKELENSKQKKPITFKANDGIPGELKGSRGVYVIRQARGDPEATYKAYTEHLKNNGNKKFPPPVGKPNNVLYVGKHKDDINKRLIEHLIKASNTTSALRLNEWSSTDYEIDVYVFQDVTPGLLHAIESCIAEQLLPAFGQHGKI